MNGSSPTPQPPAIATWWIIWFALIVGVTVIYNAIQPDGTHAPNEALRYLPIFPLIVSAIVRWFALPRVKKPTQAFPVFIVGLAMAEACAILGIFLVPSLRDTYFTLGLLGMAQFVPTFAKRFIRNKQTDA